MRRWRGVAPAFGDDEDVVLLKAEGVAILAHDGPVVEAQAVRGGLQTRVGKEIAHFVILEPGIEAAALPVHLGGALGG